MPDPPRVSLTRNPDSLPGELLELYEAEGQDPIGEGAFAIVRLARSRRTGELLALKCVEKYPLEIRSMLGQLRREVRIHQALRHPNILQLFGVFEDEAYVFMLLEYCERGNLRMLVDKSPGARLPEPRALYYFEQLARGVECMHRLGCVHRDLKLENMLLTARDELKICDFGWSAMVEGDKLLRTVCGTTTYWAPEIWDGTAQSEGMDMWALGCMLYELLAGQPPFAALEKDHLRKQVLQVHFAFPAWFSNEARNCIGGLLQRDAAQRTRCSELLRSPWFQKRQQGGPQPTAGRPHRASEPPPLASRMAASGPPPPAAPAAPVAGVREWPQLLEEVPLPPPPPPPRLSAGQISVGQQQPWQQQSGQQRMQHSRQQWSPPRHAAPLPAQRTPAASEAVQAPLPRPSLACAERRISWDLSAATPAGGGGAASPRTPSYDEAPRDAGAPPPQIHGGRPRAGLASATSRSPGAGVGRRHARAHSVSPTHHGAWATGGAARAQSEAPSLAPGQAMRGSTVVQAAAGTSPTASRVPASTSFGPMHVQANLPTALRMQLPSAQSFPTQVLSSNAGTPLGSVLMPGNKAQSFSLHSPKGSPLQSTVLTTSTVPRTLVPQCASAAPRSPRSIHGQVNAPPPPHLQRTGSGNLTGAPLMMRSMAAAAVAASAQFRPWGL